MEEGIMKTLDINQTITHWTPIAGTIFVPHTESEYETLIELLDRLIDQVGEDESHPLASMMDVIGVLIENYETEHVPELV
jgi:HTH-type transcriptional regulator / antitoxin HigA